METIAQQITWEVEEKKICYENRPVRKVSVEIGAASPTVRN